MVSISMWAYGIIEANKTIVEAVTDGWPFILSVIAPLVTLLGAYFGILRKEHRARLDAAGGQNNPSGLVGLISNVLRSKK